MPQPAAAALLAPFPTPSSPGPGAEERAQRAAHLQAVQACLEAETARSAADLQAAQARTAAAREALEQSCLDAENQHKVIAAALAGLAARLGCLAPIDAGAPLPLLSLDLPDSYARSCNQLLDLLAGYVQHHNETSGAAESMGGAALLAAEQQQHRRRALELDRRRALELEQLQIGACKAERLRVEEEAEEARLLAELEALRAHSSGPAAAASLGYSAADLQAEVTSLQRRRDARLPQVAAAAEAAVAATAGAGVIEGQVGLRQAALERRLQAKQQAAAMLAKHLSRQLLIRQLLQREQAEVQQVQLVTAAALADAEAALQAALDRLPHCAQQQGSEGDAANGSSWGTASGRGAAAVPSAASGPSGEDPVATAKELLQCRQQLAQQLGQLQSSILPAHQALFVKLHSQLYGTSNSTSIDGSGSSEALANATSSASASQAGGAALLQPELTPAVLREQLAAVTEAHSKLSLAANSLVSEVLDRQQAPGAEQSRQLAQRVLTEFWSTEGPRRLVALAAEQRRKLESYNWGSKQAQQQRIA